MNDRETQREREGQGYPCSPHDMMMMMIYTASNIDKYTLINLLLNNRFLFIFTIIKRILLGHTNAYSFKTLLAL